MNLIARFLIFFLAILHDTSASGILEDQTVCAVDGNATFIWETNRKDIADIEWTFNYQHLNEFEMRERGIVIDTNENRTSSIVTINPQLQNSNTVIIQCLFGTNSLNFDSEEAILTILGEDEPGCSALSTSESTRMTFVTTAPESSISISVTKTRPTENILLSLSSHSIIFDMNNNLSMSTTASYYSDNSTDSELYMLSSTTAIQNDDLPIAVVILSVVLVFLVVLILICVITAVCIYKKYRAKGSTMAQTASNTRRVINEAMCIAESQMIFNDTEVTGEQENAMHHGSIRGGAVEIDTSCSSDQDCEQVVTENLLPVLKGTEKFVCQASLNHGGSTKQESVDEFTNEECVALTNSRVQRSLPSAQTNRAVQKFPDKTFVGPKSFEGTTDILHEQLQETVEGLQTKEQDETATESYTSQLEDEKVARLPCQHEKEVAESEIQTLRGQLAGYIDTVQTMQEGVTRHSVIMEDIKLRQDMLNVETTPGIFIWKISEIECHFKDAQDKQTISLYSPPFHVSPHGYRACIRAYLNGDGSGKGTHISIFFVLMKSEHDNLLKWPFNRRVTFELINQENRSQSLSETFMPEKKSASFQQPKSEMNVASGFPQFAPHSVIKQHAFMKEDTNIYICCKID